MSTKKVIVDFISFSLVSELFKHLNLKGFDVKALRAFRVLRPLRLVSRAPSKYKHVDGQDFITCLIHVILPIH